MTDTSDWPTYKNDVFSELNQIVSLIDELIIGASASFICHISLNIKFLLLLHKYINFGLLFIIVQLAYMMSV